MNHPNPFARRPYQQSVLNEFVRSNSRFWALLWERQAGKSTTLADFALYEMIRFPGRTVIYASASLLLAQEITHKTAIRTNQSIRQLVEGDASALKHFADNAQSVIDHSHNDSQISSSTVGTRCCASAADQQVSPATTHTKNQIADLLNQFHTRDQLQKPPARMDIKHDGLWPVHDESSAFDPCLKPGNYNNSKVQFSTYDASTGKELIGGRGAYARQLSAASFAELFSQQRLEFRVYYDQASYSRTKVIAPNVATARSWSGTVLLDEIAFIRNLRELMTALLPVISSDKNFKLILSTTPPEFDDTHYSFELLAPPAGALFAPNAEGNWYTSESDVRVHRADAFDTALAGKKIFDLKSGDEISPAEAFTRAPNKDGHRIAHWLVWMHGGSAACDFARLKTSQERGMNQCRNFQINTDADMVPAVNWLHDHLGSGTGILPVHAPNVHRQDACATKPPHRPRPRLRRRHHHQG